MDEYFEWLKQLVSYPNTNVSFDNLFKTLHNRIFIYTIPMDENRYMDGLQLRYRFFLRTGINVMDDRRPCSMLEMMAALSWRIEEDIMDNPVIGNRTPQWFWHIRFFSEQDWIFKLLQNLELKKLQMLRSF